MSKVEPSAGADEAELERLDDEALARLVRERANQPTIPVSVDDLLAPVGSPARESLRGTLGELLPIKYGKSLPEKLRDTAGSHPVFGSSGVVGTHSSTLTSGPTLIIGRKGNVGAIHYSSEACWPIDTVYYVEPPEGQNLRYYKYLLESLNLVKLDKSTPVPGLSRDDYNAVEVVVAPPEQQDEIVAEIEKQFSRLDEAVANLKRVKANLKRFKAAVLKAAVEGRLVETEAERARREGRSYETGEQLLQRILETRRSQWKGKGKYKEPAAPDTTDLPELPEGWVWANFDQVTERVTKGSSPNWQGFEYCDKGIPFVRSQNVGWGMTDLSDIAFLPPSFNQVEKKSVLREGDVLLNIVGASIGRAAIAPSNVQGGNVNQAVAVIRLLESGVSKRFGLLYLLSAQTQRRIHAEKVDVARANFSLDDIRNIPLALPPFAEQQRLVAEVDRHLCLTDEAEAQVDSNLQRAERMRQSILTKSFSGQMATENQHVTPSRQSLLHR